MQEFYIDIYGFEFELNNYQFNVTAPNGDCIDSVFVGDGAFEDEEHFRNYCKKLYQKLKTIYEDK